MEISYLGKASYKIKTKLGLVTTDETSVAVLHKGETGKGFIINEPGEYEIEGMSVFAYGEDESVVYVVQAEDLRVLHTGNLSKMLSERVIAELENIDVVIIPSETLPTKIAVELVGKLEPYYVLPYGAGVDKFVTAFEHSSRAVKSLTLSKLMLSEDLTEVITFE